MVLLLLSLFTPLIRRLICLPNLLTANVLNSFVKTFVLSSWNDLFLSSFFLMHLHLVLYFALLNMFLFVVFSFIYFVFHIKILKKSKIKKIQKQYVFVYNSTCVPWMAIEKKFSKLCIFCSLDKHPYAQLNK